MGHIKTKHSNIDENEKLDLASLSELSAERLSVLKKLVDHLSTKKLNLGEIVDTAKSIDLDDFVVVTTKELTSLLNTYIQNTVNEMTAMNTGQLVNVQAELYDEISELNKELTTSRNKCVELETTIHALKSENDTLKIWLNNTIEKIEKKNDADLQPQSQPKQQIDSTRVTEYTYYSSINNKPTTDLNKLLNDAMQSCEPDIYIISMMGDTQVSRFSLDVMRCMLESGLLGRTPKSLRMQASVIASKIKSMNKDKLEELRQGGNINVK